MKLKMRLLAPLFAVLMLGTATSAFADLTCNVTATLGAIPGPAARAIVNGHWEQPADLLFTCTAPNATPTTDASITVYYSGLPIVNTTAIPAGHVISIPANPVGAILDTTRTDTGTASVSNSGSLVAITIPNSAGGAPAVGTFTLQNVLVSVSGQKNVGDDLKVSLNIVSPSGNTTLSGNGAPGAPVQVVTSIQPMLNSTTQPPALVQTDPTWGVKPAQFTSAGGVTPSDINCSTQPCRDAKARFAVTVTEANADAWRASATYYSNTNGVSTQGTNVLFTFAGMLPGAAITNCIISPSNATQTWTLTGSGIAGSNGTTTLVAEVTVAPLPSLTTLDTLTLLCGTSTANPAYLPGASSGSATSPITVSMSPFPVGTALPAMGGPSTAGGTPRYNATGGSVGPVTVIQFGASAAGQTMMIIPYALANIGSYDTGISIANTTKDTVFGTDAQGAAPDSTGSITFNLYPADGSTMAPITPTAGFNLNASGQIPAGNSFVGNLSSVLKAGGVTGPFQGYIIIVANFTHAHGVAYVYGGGATDRLTAAADVLVIANPIGAATGRGAYNTTQGSVEQTTK